MTKQEQTEAFQPRWNGGVAWAGAALWCVVCVALTAGPFRDHIAYFGERLGAVYEWAILGTLTSLAVWAAVYARLRMSGLWAHEPRLLAGLTLLLLLWGNAAGLAAAVLLFTMAYAVGSEALDRAGLAAPSPVAALGLAGAAGAGLIAIAMIPLGLAGAYSVLTFWAAAIGCCIVRRRRVLEIPVHLREFERRWAATPALRSPLMGVAAALLPAFLASFALAATAPAIAYDAVSHHLPAARHYLESGRLQPLPLPPGVFDGRWLYTLGHSVAYSYYPQSFEELLAFAWGLGGQGAAQMAAPLACALSLLLIVAIGRLCGLSRLACALAAVVGFTLPFAHWIGAIAKNDYLLTLFQLAALYALLRARREAGPRWIAAAAFFLGLSLGVKHTAVFLSFPLGLLMLWEIRRQARPWRLAAAMALCIAFAGLFWHARAYVLTGNPLYPAAAERGMQPSKAIGGSMPSQWTRHLTYPWYLHFDGRKVMESPSSGPAGFFFLFFVPLWLLYRRRERSLAEGAVLFALLVFYLYWAYIWGVLRYGLAPALLLALLTTGRLVAWAGASLRARRIAAASLGYCLGFALLPTLMLEVNLPQINWFVGRLDQDGYLRAALRDYPAIAFLRERHGPGENVVAVNNCSSAYAVEPAQYRCVRYHLRMAPEVLGAIAGVVRWSDPEYLVLPQEPLGDAVLNALPPGQWGKAVFADQSFQVLPRIRPAGQRASRPVGRGE